jgi:hypothetical protein
MKAEHRKELETNTLADRMGNVMQRVKTGRRSTFLLYLIVGLVLVVGGWFFYVSFIGGREDASRRWLMLDDAGLANLSSLIKNDPDTPAGKAARLQRAWLAYWELGVKRLGAEPEGAMKSLEFASDDYAALAKICVDDPIFEPQALLGIAVVEETRAIMDTANLDRAADAYQKLFDKYKDEDSKPKNAEATFAKERLDKLNDKKQRAEIVATYEDLKKGLGVRVPVAALPFDPINLPKKKD